MERIARIKDDLIAMVEEQVARGGLHNIDTHELGDVVDMIKDLAEACYYCEKAKEAKMCNEEMEYDEYDYRDRDRKTGRMFYPGGNSGSRGGNSGSRGGSYNTTAYARGMRGGRRGFSENNPMDSREIEHYINDLSEELIDMLRDINPEDKAVFQQKISSLANKIK